MNRLTESDLDLHESGRMPLPPIQSVESEHPLLWLLYGVAIVAAVGGSIWARYS